MILVAGATGQLGGMITNKLLATGQETRILVRADSDHQTLVDAGAQPVVGDFKEPDTLRVACADVQAVITTVNSASRGGDDTVETVDLSGNRNLIEAAQAAGVRRFVFVSALGAAPDHPVPFLRAKAATEAYLRQSGLDWTVLQPTAFMDLWVPLVVGRPALQDAPVYLVDGGRRRHSLVAARDVAAYVVASLTASVALGAIIPIGGPEAVSFRDVVDQFQRQMGKRLQVHDLPLRADIPGWPPVLSELYTGMALYDSPVEMTRIAQDFDVTPISLEDFVHGFLNHAS